VIPYYKDETYTYLIEPSFKYGFISLGTGMFYADLARENEDPRKQIDMPGQYFLYVNPVAEVTPKVSMGVNYEYHDHSFKATKDVRHVLTPVTYLYPNENMAIMALMGMTMDQNWDHGAFTASIKSMINF
jgi:hypothetical protein